MNVRGGEGGDKVREEVERRIERKWEREESKYQEIERSERGEMKGRGRVTEGRDN